VQERGYAEVSANLSAMQSDEVQKQFAEVAKALYQRTDELAVLLARDYPPFVVGAADVRLSAPRRCGRSRARRATSTCIPRGSAEPYNDCTAAQCSKR
jgi:hypothetical protein